MKTFQIPGTRDLLTYDILPNGELGRLHVAGIDYLKRHGQAYVFDGGWFQFEEQHVGRTLLRKVTTKQGPWVETYGWDDKGMVTAIDGCLFERNEMGYIRRCGSGDQQWDYHYQDHQLIAIAGPQGRRDIRFDNLQRPLAIEVDGRIDTFRYDNQGLREDTPAPKAGWHVDDLGRLWTIKDHLGHITTTYLWWGFACLARIDGPPGDPIAEIFSLDPTGTPVRATTPQAMRRFPRDAFGESLSGQEGVPGLFGGAQNGRFVHYRSRTLDTFAASFTAADPFDGSAMDPRRHHGFTGALPVEQPPAGPYCVCQHDPCSRMDPTGEMSRPGATAGTIFSTLSSLSWGFQNNLTGITLLGLWNILLSLLSFNGKVIKRIGDMEGMHSPWSGAWGIRAHPSGLELLGVNRHRAWTVQHVIWARGEEFEELDKARVFVPDATYIPKLDGSLLLIQPDHGKEKKDPGVPFVLAGNQHRQATANQTNGFAPFWTRSGGVGKPVFEGATTPWFPEGGIHFPYQRRVHSPVKSTIAEIYPTGEVYQGEMRSRLTIVSDDLDKPPAKGDLVLTKKKKDIDFYTVRGHFKEEDLTILVTEEVPTTLVHETIKLFDAKLEAKSENLANGTSIRHLDTSNRPPAVHYEEGQYVKLEGGVPDKEITGAEISAIEGTITLDEHPPATAGTAPFKLFLAKQLVIQGMAKVTSKTEITFGADDPKPDVNQVIVLADGGDKGIYQVSAGGDAQTFVPDRDISPALVAAGDVQWFRANRETFLGEWDGVGGANDINYTPETSGHVPDTGQLVFKNKEKDILGVRNITAMVRDQIEVSKDLPGGAHAHEVTLFKKGKCLDGHAETRDRSVLFVDESAAKRTTLAASSVIHLLQLSDNNITNATSNAVSNGFLAIQNQPWSGHDLNITSFTAADFPTGFGGTFAPMPGQMVVLRKTTTQDIELATVKSLQGTVSLSNAPSFPAGFAPAGDKWELIPLEEEGLCFKGIRKSNTEVLLQSEAYHMTGNLQFDKGGGGVSTDTVWLPRFRKGELVRAIWEAGGPQVTGQYRITAVDGAYLTLEGHPVLPAGMTDLAICKLVPGSPESGTYAAGRTGKRVNPTTYEFAMLHPNGIPEGTYALAYEKHVWAVTTSGPVSALKIGFYGTPGLAGSNVNVVIPRLEDVPIYSANHQVIEDEWFLTESHLLPSNQRMLIRAFKDPAAGDLHKGKLSPGTTLIPDDSTDSFELNRRESLETHELQHTLQFLMQGPLVFAVIPLFIFDLIGVATGEGLESPEFSEFVTGSLTTVGGTRYLQISEPGDIDFSTGRTVQVVQNANAQKAPLGDSDSNGFRTNGLAQISDGQVAIRLERKSATKKLADAHAVLEFLTTGGLQQTLMGPILSGIPWIVSQIIQECQGSASLKVLPEDVFPATVPDVGNPFVIQVPPHDGNAHDFEVHDCLELNSGNNIKDCYLVVALDGEMVSLDKPARFDGPGNELTVTKIGDKHPMRQYVDFIPNAMGVQDMRWFFDPLGQMFYELDPNDQGSLDWALTFLRPFYSTTSWSGMGIFGGFWNDIAYTTAFTGGKDYLSYMEQGASEASGDLYSPVGRLRGDLKYVGDVGRYLYYHDTANGGNFNLECNRLDKYVIELRDFVNTIQRIERLGYRIGDEVQISWANASDSGSQYFEIVSMEKKLGPPVTLEITVETIPGLDSIGGIPTGFADYFISSSHISNYDSAEIYLRPRGDEAGPHQQDYLRAMPFRSNPGPAASAPPNSEPNLAASSPSPSSQALPHQLFLKNTTTPLGPGSINPDSYQPSTMGMMPSPPRLQRARGMYVSFCQPSNDPHRLTIAHVPNRQGSLEEGRLAHTTCPDVRQTLYFDKQVKDVKVFHGDEVLAATLDLVLCQKATLRVEPEKKRVYNLTVADPKHDDIARNVADMSILAQEKTGSTSIEIARAYDGKTPQTHLSLPFVVPVRTMTVNVGDSLDLLEEPELDATVVSGDAEPGDTFYLLIPAKLTKADLTTVQTLTYTTAPPAGHIDPDTGMKAIAKKDLDKKVKAFLGAGQAIRVEFKIDDPPEEPVDIAWDIEVEAGQAHAPVGLKGVLKASIKLNPHFRLTGDPDLSALEIEGETITLKTDPATVEITDEVIITAEDGIANPQDKFEIAVADDGKSLVLTTKENTVPGKYQVLVTSDSNGDHKARRTIEIIG